jgi:hypothetical protein
MLVGALTAIALGALAPSQSPPPDQRFCHLIGCTPGVSVRFDKLPRVVAERGERMTVCAAGHCVVAKNMLNKNGVALDAPVSGLPVRVVVVVRGAQGNVLWRRERLVRAIRWTPNGPECPPVCWRINLAVDGAFLRVLPGPQ